MINVILQFNELDLVNINVSAKFYKNIPSGLKVNFYCFQNLNLGKTAIKSIFTQKSIKIFHSVQEIRPFSLFQNLALDKASTDDKCHFAIVSLFSEFEPRQKLNQSQMSFDYLMGYIMSKSMCMQDFITIFQSVQEIGPFSLFQNLELGKASTDEKCHFAIFWARSW